MTTSRLKFIKPIVSLALALFVLAGHFPCAGAQAPPPASDSAKAEALTTTEKDQTEIAVTVYNSNIALVRDVRQIRLAPGIFPLRFEDVAASINPATVHFRSLTDDTKLSVVEQNYEYDLLDPQKLLQKYVGKEVTLVRAEQDAGSHLPVLTTASRLRRLPCELRREEF